MNAVAKDMQFPIRIFCSILFLHNCKKKTEIQNKLSKLLLIIYNLYLYTVYIINYSRRFTISQKMY